MIKKIYQILSLFILVIFLSSWGGVGHGIINKKVPESFPTTMAAFTIWSDSLSANASVADQRKDTVKTEGIKHYIDIDNYTEFISKGRIVSTYDSIVNLHGISTVESNGTLPWATVNMYNSLIVDFKTLKWHQAMLDASDLGHYVADGHMPLHITANFDGGSTGQKGIHSRYETGMVGVYSSNLRANYTGETDLHIISNVNKYIMDYIYFDYKYKDSVLLADKFANSYTGGYNPGLWLKTQYFTTMLFRNSSHSIAELIYNAWVTAGSPPFGATVFVNGLSNTTENNISVFPNPTKGILNIVGDNILKTEVTNISGSSMGIFYDKKVDISSLSNGMYILSMYGNDGTMKREKILLTK